MATLESTSKTSAILANKQIADGKSAMYPLTSAICDVTATMLTAARPVFKRYDGGAAR